MSTDYSKMSDFEINKLVAIATGHKQLGSLGWRGLKDGEFNEVMVRGPLKIGGFDPCNNPADAWPIIVQNGISVECITVNRHEKMWRALFKPAYVRHKQNNKNPLRAAMIVFLMMRESKNAS